MPYTVQRRIFPIVQLTRRGIIKTGFAGSIVLGLGGTGLFLRETILVSPKSPLLALNEHSFSILVAVADRIIPQGEKFPAPRKLGIAEKVDRLLSGLHPGDVTDFKNGLFLIENGLTGFLLDGRTTAFTSSAPEVQDHTLESFRTSRLQVRRSIYKAVYGMVSACYWSCPETYAATGYEGPPEFGSGFAAGPSRPPIKRRGIEPKGPLEKDDKDEQQ
ncbi:MAG: gluconate 2-dehydrogenase subunit 3 family protein [Myxococcota bacterium]|nr:gluconate 2-dehydrogenase subunit 3 family protein [Myxococcota bacterium]